MTETGLKHNWKQFTLLVVINAFVGGMVGLERSIFPDFAESVFGISSASAILSFIAAFGLSKAIANYFTGRWANKVGRKKLLVIGWIIALPVPFLFIFAESWTLVVFANVLLGISQGLTWSSAVVMKIDLAGEKSRGLAMGLNEFAGYLAVGLMAFFSASIAADYGIRPYPFYLGIGLSGLGLLMSFLWVKDTRLHVATEGKRSQTSNLKHVFWETTWKNPTLGAITQAGLVNNLNDGMIWGLLPMYLANISISLDEIGWIAGIYPLVWGIGQLFTGKMGDHYSKKKLLIWGMFLQGWMIVALPFAQNFTLLMLLAGTLGLGTSLVYPNFLSAVADATHPNQRAESIGTFRLWRDLGYVFGALLSGWMADQFGIPSAMIAIGFLTLISSGILKWRMR